ncbi:hypothetical protein PVK06_042312 [Gossypium arboreum]|uniref:Uncharacterized protein n=1 Tax=Gossypium arboreum TaxID=29729 RepID=A0ABR0MKR7_GOSAR|nr:hypothetical protein PVK06_042312 [Gossypium arboreum]
MVLYNYIRRHARSNDRNFREFENVPNMLPSRSHFNQGESNSSDSEGDTEIELLRETIATSLMSSSSQRNVVS